MRTSPQTHDPILVIGASGQLGLALCQEFGSKYNVVAASRSHVDQGQHYVDLADETGLIRLLEDVQANTILIAAAMCHVDRCELEPKVCHSVNVTGTELVARHASRTGALVVFFQPTMSSMALKRSTAKMMRWRRSMCMLTRSQKLN